LKLNNNLLNSNTDIINSTMVIELKKNEKNKVLSIKANSLALNAVPDFIIDKIVSKFKTLLILENQYKFFLYIDNISKINQGNKNDIYNSILIDSYNNSLTYSSQSPQFGNADIRSSTYLLYIFILSITTLVFLSLWIRNTRIIKPKNAN